MHDLYEKPEEARRIASNPRVVLVAMGLAVATVALLGFVWPQHTHELPARPVDPAPMKVPDHHDISQPVERSTGGSELAVLFVIAVIVMGLLVAGYRAQ